MSGERRYPDGTIDQPWWRYDGNVTEWRAEQDAKLMAALLVALERPDALTANILRLWPREQIVTFAKHLLGTTCQRCGEHEPRPVDVDGQCDDCEYRPYCEEEACFHHITLQQLAMVYCRKCVMERR